MKHLICVVGVSLWASTVSAQSVILSNPYPIGYVDGVIGASAGANVATITGWSFHPGGSAILKVRVFVDCDPFAQAGCQASRNYFQQYPRNDVVQVFWFWPVPESSGWTVGYEGWAGLSDGWHTIYAMVTDAQHGPDAWFALVKRPFLKCGGDCYVNAW